MSYTFLLEQGEVSSVESFSGIPVSVLSKLNLTVGKCSCSGNVTESCPGSPSGMTLKRLTDETGEARLMWYVEDSPVRTYLPPVKEAISTGSDLDCGPSLPGSLARYSPNTYSWRTAQCSLLGGLTSYSEIFPRWGMMRDGELSELVPVVARWNESGFGLPAPTKSMGKRGWGISNSGRARYSKELQENARLFGYKPHLSILEWSMGWIPTWTRLAPLETDKYQQWLNSHGKL